MREVQTGRAPSYLDRLQGLLGAAQTIGNVVGPGATVAFAGYDALKGAVGGARIRGDVGKAVLQGFTGEHFTGLGDAVTNEPFLSGALNTGEIVVPFPHGAINRAANSPALGAFQGIPGVGAALKDISPNAFTIHPEDSAILKG
jgi:hypothetical protein